MNPWFVLAVGALILLAILVVYLVRTLNQMKRTASAMEDLLRGIQPRIEHATASIDSLVSRSDRIMGTIEQGTRRASDALGGLSDGLTNISSFIGSFRPPIFRDRPNPKVSQWVSAGSSLLTGVWEAWSAFTHSPASAYDADGGRSHER